MLEKEVVESLTRGKDQALPEQEVDESTHAHIIQENIYTKKERNRRNIGVWTQTDTAQQHGYITKTTSESVPSMATIFITDPQARTERRTTQDQEHPNG